MSNSNADRNLLIGVLALQMDFVSREQLIQAMHAWVLNKSLSLDAILRQHAAVDEETRQLLVALVDKHVHLHAGDTAKSLASLAPAGAIPVELRQLNDHEVAATLEMLSEPTIPMAPTHTVPYPTAGQFTSKGQRFRILRPHNAGGLGVVSVARDEEFGREVALKEIKESHAHNQENRRRFLLEAEITGGLEHPGIIPVYGLGQYPDGRPYYAMRFIRGDSLQDAIDKFHTDEKLQAEPRRRAIELRKLLRRLVDVCNAVEYAHSRGVLHRDLKPSNVMLGKYGETLVVDWGLAKAGDASTITNRDEPPLRLLSGGTASGTQMGHCFGTPGFISPEQSEGRLDLLKPASDVYSLGATLYILLTGEIAFERAPLPELLKKIRTGDFPAPRARDARIAPALEAICLKAMALQAEDRYPSAAALAADIENWLGDEPVSAYPDPLATKLARWSRHHRSLVSSIGTATFASILLLSVSIALLLAANSRERHARELAQSERQRAEDNLETAKQAVATMLTEVGREKLAQLPQMAQTRSTLLGKARDFYERFQNQKPTDAALRLETALAWRSLAEIDRQSGNIAEAQNRYLTAIEQLRTLSTEYPQGEKYRLALGGTFNDLGWLLIRSDSQQAETNFGQAIELLQPMAKDLSAQELARSLYNRGLVRAELSRFPEAKTDYEEAIQILEQLASKSAPQADGVKIQRELARTYNNLANLLRATQDVPGARANAEKAINALKVLTQARTKDRDLIEEQAIFENNLADLQRLQGDLTAAEMVSNEALEKLTTLAQPLPFLAGELANSLHVRGTILAQMNKKEQAELDYIQTRELLQRLTHDYPEVGLYHDRLGNALFQLARLRFDSKKYSEGTQFVSQAIEEHRIARQANSNEPIFAQHLKNDFVGAALLLVNSGDHAKAFEFTEQLVSDFHIDADVLFDAAQLAARCLTALQVNSAVGPPERVGLQTKYRAMSLAWLSEAEKAGFQNAKKIDRSQEPGQAFDPVKTEAEFLSVLSRLRAKAEVR